MVGWDGGEDEPTQADALLELLITGRERPTGSDGKPTGMFG